MTTSGQLDVVTGALSYTGRHIAQRLLDRGGRVRTLTGHPDRDPQFARRLEVEPYRFDDPVALAASLRGATTLYNTFWVRFVYGRTRFEDAVEQSHALFAAARRAGVERIVHVSITNPSLTSDLPYFRGKAMVEEALAATGVPFAIVRPTVVFGPATCSSTTSRGCCAISRCSGSRATGGTGYARCTSTTWPVCASTGPARRATWSWTRSGRHVHVRRAGGRDRPGDRASRRVVHLPPVAVQALSQAIGAGVHDSLLTRDELRGLMRGLVDTAGPATGTTSLPAWLADHAATLGRAYASELARHYDAATTCGRVATAA